MASNWDKLKLYTNTKINVIELQSVLFAGINGTKETGAFHNIINNTLNFYNYIIILFSIYMHLYLLFITTND